MAEARRQADECAGIGMQLLLLCNACKSAGPSSALLVLAISWQHPQPAGMRLCQANCQAAHDVTHRRLCLQHSCTPQPILHRHWSLVSSHWQSSAQQEHQCQGAWAKPVVVRRSWPERKGTANDCSLAPGRSSATHCNGHLNVKHSAQACVLLKQGCASSRQAGQHPSLSPSLITSPHRPSLRAWTPSLGFQQDGTRGDQARQVLVWQALTQLHTRL